MKTRRFLNLLPLAGLACAAALCTSSPAFAIDPTLIKSQQDRQVRLRDGAMRQTPATPASPPPPVPAVKAAVTFPPNGFYAHGYYADMFISGTNLSIMNSINLEAGGGLRIGIKPSHANAFPQGTFNLVVTGRSLGLIGSLTMTALADPSRTVSCPFQRAVDWRCVLTLPVGTVGQQRHVGVSTNAMTSIGVVSIE